MEIYIPDGISREEALGRTTHLSVAAHQDDIEIMAYHGILECFAREDRWFTGAVVTNGSGSPRADLYENCSDEDMMKIRKKEQKKAAIVGDYAAQVLMDYTSSEVKDPANTTVADSIREIVMGCRPSVVYTHNLADKHDTHVGVAVKTIKALRTLDKEYLPEKVYGCEVWRALDWMNDNEKVCLDIQGRSCLENALLGVFDSQICGGKRYDLAAIGRRIANATYAQSHSVDATSALIFAMDLTPLITDKTLSMRDYATGFIDRFREDVLAKVGRLDG